MSKSTSLLFFVFILIFAVKIVLGVHHDPIAVDSTDSANSTRIVYESKGKNNILELNIEHDNSKVISKQEGVSNITRINVQADSTKSDIKVIQQGENNKAVININGHNNKSRIKQK